MKHEGPSGGTPYREPADPNAESLERMRRQIEAEGKHGVLFDPEVGYIGKSPQFVDLIKNKKVDPKQIVFYSTRSGILPYWAYDAPIKNEYAYGKASNRVIIVYSPKKNTAIIYHELASIAPYPFQKNY